MQKVSIMHYINLRHELRWSIDSQVLIRCYGAIARVSKTRWVTS